MAEPATTRAVQSDGKVYVGCMFYAEKPGEQSEYPNVGRMSSTSSRFQEVYWRSMLVFFASVRKTNPTVALVLFSNARPPRPEWGRLLNSLDVELVPLEYDSHPPSGYWHSWQSTFYILDVLAYMAPRMTEQDSLILLDLDVVVVSNLDPMIRVLRKEGFLNLSIDYPADYPIHEHSRRDLGEIFREMRGAATSSAHAAGEPGTSDAAFASPDSHLPIPDPPVFLGGEIYGFHGRSVVELISRAASTAYRLSLERRRQGKRAFHTEEHLFSFVMWSLGLANNHAGPFIKRIWTTHDYRNVELDDMNLLAWHVPAEKRRGLIRLSFQVLSRNSRFWRADSEEFKVFVGKRLGIPKRPLWRWMVDKAKGLIRKWKLH